MTHSFGYSSTTKAFELTFSNQVDCDDIVKLLSCCFEHPKFKFGSRYILDFRFAKLNFLSGELIKLTQFIENIRGNTQVHYRMVAVSRDSDNRTVLEQWQHLVCTKNTEAFRVVDSYDTAVKWLQSTEVANGTNH